MKTDTTSAGTDYQTASEPIQFEFGVTRRDFVQVLGAGLLIAVAAPSAVAQQARGGRGGGGARGGGGGFAGSATKNVAARLHIGQDGIITVMTGKVESGQGARAELTQAAAEELRVPAEQIRLVMADTALVPDDGMTAGSRSTPATVPAVRQGCAAARELLAALASGRWGVGKGDVEVRGGKVVHAPTGRSLAYADLATDDKGVTALQGDVPANVALTPVAQWKVLGQPTPRPNGRDLVTGGHHFPSDITRPEMLYGKILRAPSYGAKLLSIDLAPAKAMKNVVAVQDGQFVGVVAPTAFAAQEALDAVADTAKWETAPHPSSSELSAYLVEHARGGVPKNPFADEIAKAAKTLHQTYHVAYVQHAPMEPRTAVAEWDGGKLTVWTATQNPFGVRGELARAFRLGDDAVRVIVPDFGGGFGGKHTGESAVEAARLAQAAGKPVWLRWTRQEEFTWAYFRPAAVLDAEASLDDKGNITSWHYTNVNSGSSAVESPYKIAKSKSQYVTSNPPLRHGSYRGLASTANVFGRECFMDELAAAAGRDPLEFRLAHLDNPRLRAVLEAAAKAFDWPNRVKKKDPALGVGLACGTEKGSFVAACAEVAIDREAGAIKVLRATVAYECGPIHNPHNLRLQVVGAIIQGIGPALREEMKFEGGKILNGTFGQYQVPRLEDVPELDIHLLDRPDLPPVGAGETPIIAIAPAMANAVYHATGERVRTMPIRLAKKAVAARGE